MSPTLIRPAALNSLPPRIPRRPEFPRRHRLPFGVSPPFVRKDPQHHGRPWPTSGPQADACRPPQGAPSLRRTATVHFAVWTCLPT